MSGEALFQRMARSIVDGEAEVARELMGQALAAGIDPHACINRGFKPGLDEVGRGFESGEYFLPDLMVAGKVMQGVVAMLEDELRKDLEARESLGRVMLATVAGDLHTIGKDLVGLMLTLNGFEVIDLGPDVPVATIVARVGEERPDIVGLSALLTTTTQVQKEVIESLEEAGLRGEVKVLVGGAATTGAWAEQIGADGYARDAASAVRKAKEVLGIA